jgi:hypothetical protein
MALPFMATSTSPGTMPDIAAPVAQQPLPDTCRAALAPRLYKGALRHLSVKFAVHANVTPSGRRHHLHNIEQSVS